MGNACCRTRLLGCLGSHRHKRKIEEKGQRTAHLEGEGNCSLPMQTKNNSGKIMSQESLIFHSPSRLLTCHKFSLSSASLP